MKQYYDPPSATHYRINSTYQAISKRYCFTGMRKYITDFVKNCTDYQSYKGINQKTADLLLTPIYERRFEALFDSFSETIEGYRSMYIIDDMATKWIELYCLWKNVRRY